MRCPNCGEWFLTKRKLDWHIEEHHMEREEKYTESVISRIGTPSREPSISPQPSISREPVLEEIECNSGGEFSGAGASGDYGSDSSDSYDSDNNNN